MNPTSPSPFSQTFFHGTKADLKMGDLIQPGYQSNYTAHEQLNHVYFTATLDAAIWGAELANGEGRQRIYLVEPTGEMEDDPNVTNKRFPGNPTRSYRSIQPVRVVGEVAVWQGHPPEQVNGMKEALAKLREEGRDTIEN